MIRTPGVNTLASAVNSKAAIRNASATQGGTWGALVAQCSEQGATRGITMDELRMMGCKNSSIITLEVLNTNGTDVFMILGTPLGDPNESGNYASLLASIGTVATEAPTSGNITDDKGVGATFIKSINQRARRNPFFVNNIKIVTSDDAQRQERVRVLEVPYNDATDSRVRAQEFIPVDTEWTGSAVATQGAVIGEFYGLIYKLKDTITTQFNIELAAHSVTSFQQCNPMGY